MQIIEKITHFFKSWTTEYMYLFLEKNPQLQILIVR